MPVWKIRVVRAPAPASIVTALAITLAIIFGHGCGGGGGGGGAGASSPLAEFSASPRTGAAPLEVTFSNLSVGSIANVHWDFGDGEQSTETNPSHRYEQPGLYDVVLTVNGPHGTNQESKLAYVEALACAAVCIAGTSVPFQPARPTSLGDIDGDAIDDYCVGTDIDPSGMGVIRAYSGVGCTAIWEATGPLAQFGAHYLRIDDVDLDGASDLWAGRSDQIEVLSGRDGHRIHLFPSPATSGPSSTGLFVSIGDVSGDGRGDVASFFNLAVQIYSGANGALLDVRSQLPDFIYHGAVEDQDQDGAMDFTVLCNSSSTLCFELRSSRDDSTLFTSPPVAIPFFLPTLFSLSFDGNDDGVTDFFYPAGVQFIPEYEHVLLSGTDWAVLWEVSDAELGLRDSQVSRLQADHDADGVPDVVLFDAAPRVVVLSGRTGAVLSSFSPAFGSTPWNLEPGIIGNVSGGPGSEVGLMVPDAPEHYCLVTLHD